MTLFDLERDPSASTGSSAWLSDDRAYRYRLHRRWSSDGPLDVWVMLNPSTADALVDDPTIRRCKGFSALWGAGGIVVVNLFALRATFPSALAGHPDPVGPDNDGIIRQAVLDAHRDGGRIICAWGAHTFAAPRALDVAEGLRGMEALCLGTTKAGAPRHPLYVRGDTEPIPWEPAR